MTELESKWLQNFKLFGENKYLLPEHQVKFHDVRKFEFDFAWTHASLMIAVEIEGGQWIKGGHTSGKGLQRDCEKYNLAQFNGWKVFRFSTSMIDESKHYDMLFEIIPRIR